MSKAVLISIRPKWCELIANGTKTVEVRKSRPKLHTPFKCYIYCTSYKHLAFAQDAAGANPIACIDAETAIPVGGFVGNAKVIGEFICDRIYELAPLNHAPSDVEQQACLTREEIVQYRFAARMSAMSAMRSGQLTATIAMTKEKSSARRRAGVMSRN